MLASFQDWGNRASLKEQLRISVTGSASKSAFSLRSQPGIPSGPVALVGFKADSFFKTENSDTWKALSWSELVEVLGERGVKTRIGAKNAWLMVLAMSIVLGGEPLWPQSICW